MLERDIDWMMMDKVEGTGAMEDSHRMDHHGEDLREKDRQWDASES